MMDNTIENDESLIRTPDPLDETSYPIRLARTIIDASLEGNSFMTLTAMLQHAINQFCIPKLRQRSLFLQKAITLAFKDKNDGISGDQSLHAHDWDSLWEECSQ